jgi:outer membrane protein assembly factor BamE (lipoprotein component of BamABCDE complex)
MDQTFCTLYTFAATCILIGGQQRTWYYVKKVRQVRDSKVDQTFCTLYTFAATCVLIGGQQRTWYYVKKVRQVRDSKGS